MGPAREIALDATSRGARRTRGAQPAEPELLLAPLAVAVAGAAGAPDLVERISEALGSGDDRPAPVRIWLLEGGARPQLLAQHPRGSKHPRDEPDAVVAAALMEDVLSAGSALLASLRHKGTPYAVFAVGGGRIGPAGLRELADVVAARLTLILAADSEPVPQAATGFADIRSDTQALMAAFAAEAKRLLDHDRLSVYLVTPDGCAVERFAVATSAVLPGESDLIPLEDYGLTYILDTNEPLVTGDFTTDERIRCHEGTVIAAGGFHGMVSVPLRVSGKPIGLLNFVSKTPGFYSVEDAAIAQQIADQVAIFFQNLRFEQRLRLAIEREAGQQERNRLARELHDTLAQSLAAMLQQLDPLARRLRGVDDEAEDTVSEVRAATQSMLRELRRSLLHLGPAELERKSLGDAIADTLAEVEGEHGIKTSIEIVGAPGAPPAEVAAVVFRIFQEAIANARIHARATSLGVTLRIGDGITLSVEDNGVDSGEASQAGRLGIRNMRERAEEIGGHLLLAACEDGGTIVTLTVPSLDRAVASGQLLTPPSMPRASSRITRVLVVDDQPLFRQAVTRALERQVDLRVVGQAGTAAAAVAEARRRKPDVVLLSLELPDASGIDAVRRIVALRRPPAVLMISTAPESGHVLAAMKAGARGFVAKTIESQNLLDSIRAIGSGATLFDAASRNGIWSPVQLARLTRRELEVLRLIATGKTNEEIAEELCLARKTVERIVAAAVAKLRARNRAHGVARAVALKLFDVGID